MVVWVNLRRCRWLQPYCSEESADESRLILGSYEGPTLRIAIEPAVCTIATDEASGRKYIDYDKCKPSQLVVTTTPGPA